MNTVKTFDDSAANYHHVSIERQVGNECFHIGTQILPINLLSFWQWSASDLIGNTTRGCLAEYIVAIALGQTDGVRNDWKAYDLQFNEWNIEVKASAYLQSWFQKRLCRPNFSIRPARKWDAQIGELTGEPRRHAHLYVFCLHAHKDKKTLNPLNMDQWEFYVLPTARFDGLQRYKHAKTIGLSSLRTLKPHTARFADLKHCIVDVLSQMEKEGFDGTSLV